MEALRVEVARRRLRLKDRFQDFDGLRRGHVTMAQFRRCLAAMGIVHVLQDEDVAALERLYASPTQDFQYLRFLADLYGEEPPQDIMSPARGLRHELPADEAAELDAATERCVRRIVTDGLDVTRRFKDFDRLNSGRITAAQFERAFPFQVEPIIVTYLKKKYGDAQGDVCYRNWCDDVVVPLMEKISAEEAPNLSPTQRRSLPTSALLQEMRRHFALYRHRCEDAFRDFDKGRRGTVSPPQFASVMGRIRFMKMALTPEDIDGLVRRYTTADVDGHAGVNYVAFLRDVTEPVELKPATLPIDEERRVAAVLDKLRNAIRIHRSHVRPTLHDFDRATKGVYQTRTCTRSRFERALAVHKLLLTPEEVGALFQRYAVPRADGLPSDVVDYYAFLRDVEPNDGTLTTDGAEVEGNPHATSRVAETARAGTLPPLTPTASPKRSLPPLGDVLDKIRERVVERRIRLKEFLEDFDPLRSGLAEEQKLLSAMAMGGLSLTEADLQVLADAYRSERVPGFVDVQRFLKDVDVGAEIRPLPEPPFDRELTILEARRSPRRRDTAGLVGEVLLRIARNVRSRGVLLPQFFGDADRHHTGRVTPSQFLQVVSRYHLPVTADEGDALVSHYRHPTGDVDYRAFMGDVDESENVELQRTLRTGPPTLSGTVGSAPTTARVADVLARLSAFVKRKAVRLSEFFRDGDPLRHGTVTASRFRHAVDILGITLEEAELRALETAFAAADDPERVRYGEFLAAANGTAPPPLPDNRLLDTEAYLQQVIARVAKAFSARRIVSRPCFQDFDKLRKLCVTEAQFFSCLLSVGLMLHPREAIALKERFGIGGGLMGYDAFCSAVDANM